MKQYIRELISTFFCKSFIRYLTLSENGISRQEAKTSICWFRSLFTQIGTLNQGWDQILLRRITTCILLRYNNDGVKKT